ncbi:Protein SRG1 [Glycine soja]|nr:Protein SRG1 [Glycine soja]
MEFLFKDTIVTDFAAYAPSEDSRQYEGFNTRTKETNDNIDDNTEMEVNEPETDTTTQNMSSTKENGQRKRMDSSLVEKVKRGAQGLFDLSMEEKKKFGQREGEAEGYGQLFVILEEQNVCSVEAMEPTSLTVPFVQEIAKDALTRVPERYVRPLHERPILLSATTTPLPQVPVIDLSKLLSQDLKEPELEKLHYACKEWGFFQLINHGVSTSLVEKVKRGAQDFFNLPIEEKKKLGQREGEGVEGYGQAFVVSEEQKLEWADMFFMLTLPPHIRKPYLFPNIPLPFRDDLETYSAGLKKLAIQIVELMANALNVDSKEIRELFGEGVQSMRMNYYPPCPQPELVMGLNPHTDGGSLTILLQLNEVEGLQIKIDGSWIPIKPLPNAFIVNLGDMMEIMTNGIYRSIEHRATVNLEKERLSIATFYNPGMEVKLGPAPSLVTPTTPAVFKTISVPEYYRGYLSRELRGRSYLDSMKIQNEDENSS